MNAENIKRDKLLAFKSAPMTKTFYLPSSFQPPMDFFPHYNQKCDHSSFLSCLTLISDMAVV